MEVLAAIKQRRSIRSYAEAQITDDQLGTVLEAGLWAPSGFNVQGWHLCAIQSQEKLSELNERLRAYMLKSNMPPIVELAQDESQTFYYGAPTVIIVSGNPKVPTVVNDCSLALGNMMLAAYDLGLASCWLISLTGVSDKPEIRAFLSDVKVPKNYEVYGCLALGYSSEQLPEAPMRKPGKSVIIK